MRLSLVCPQADFSSWFFALFSLFVFARTKMRRIEESELQTTCRQRKLFLILKSTSWSQSLWTTLTMLLGKLASAAMSKRLGSQMKDFSDTTIIMAFPVAKGAFLLVLVNLLSVFREILICQPELVDCDNMIGDQSRHCKSLTKPNALRNW